MGASANSLLVLNRSARDRMYEIILRLADNIKYNYDDGKVLVCFSSSVNVTA